MTLGIIGAVLGALFGVVRSRRSKGNTLDMLQYAAVHALIFGVLGVIVAVALVRNV